MVASPEIMIDLRLRASAFLFGPLLVASVTGGCGGADDSTENTSLTGGRGQDDGQQSSGGGGGGGDGDSDRRILAQRTGDFEPDSGEWVEDGFVGLELVLFSDLTAIQHVPMSPPNVVVSSPSWVSDQGSAAYFYEEEDGHAHFMLASVEGSDIEQRELSLPEVEPGGDWSFVMADEKVALVSHWDPELKQATHYALDMQHEAATPQLVVQGAAMIGRVPEEGPIVFEVPDSGSDGQCTLMLWDPERGVELEDWWAVSCGTEMWSSDGYREAFAVLEPEAPGYTARFVTIVSSSTLKSLQEFGPHQRPKMFGSPVDGRFVLRYDYDITDDDVVLADQQVLLGDMADGSSHDPMGEAGLSQGVRHSFHEVHFTQQGSAIIDSNNEYYERPFGPGPWSVLDDLQSSSVFSVEGEWGHSQWNAVSGLALTWENETHQVPVGESLGGAHDYHDGLWFSVITDRYTDQEQHHVYVLPDGQEPVALSGLLGDSPEEWFGAPVGQGEGLFWGAGGPVYFVDASYQTYELISDATLIR